MPIHWDKHKEEGVVDLSDFQGGVNLVNPPTILNDNEQVWLENFYFDPASGKPRTRYPIVRYSNSAPSANPITALYYWNSKWFLVGKDAVDADTLYYLDANKDPVSLGALNGGSKPTFCSFNNKLLIASGGTLQYTTNTDPPAALADVTNAPKGTYVFQKDGRVVIGGDPDNLDRVWQSNVFDETVWSGGGDDYADVGYLDGLEVKGVKEFADGLFIVFKRGDTAQRSYFLSSLSTSAPVCRLISETHCAMSHYGVADAVGKLYIMEKNVPTSFIGTDARGELIVDPSVGMKITSAFEATENGFLVVYPPDFQMWFIPDPMISKAYIYHYMRNAWSIFSFGTIKIHSAFYHPSDNILYLGCDDGFIYKYNSSATVYQDEGSVNYNQMLRTKVFDFKPRREKIVKSPILFYEGINAGNVTFYIRKSFGNETAYSSTVTLDDSGTRLVDTQSIYIYDTQEGGDDEMFLYDESALSTHKFDVNIPLDNFQFRLEVSQGGLLVDSIVTNVAIARDKV
jgi:hypothetical protein